MDVPKEYNDILNTASFLALENHQPFKDNITRDIYEKSVSIFKEIIIQSGLVYCVEEFIEQYLSFNKDLIVEEVYWNGITDRLNLICKYELGIQFFLSNGFQCDVNIGNIFANEEKIYHMLDRMKNLVV